MSVMLLFVSLATLQSCGDQGTEPTPPPPAPIYEVPASIDAAGGADVTDQLLAFFASVPDSSTITFPANATYRIENTLLLKDRFALTFEGNGATFFATTTGSGVTPDPLIRGAPGDWPRGRRHWMFVGGGGITIKNITIRGANPYAGLSDSAYNAALEAQHGIEFMAVNGSEVSGVTITDIYGDFLLASPLGTTWSSNAWWHGNTLSRNGRQGIAVTGGQDLLFEHNTMTEIRRSAFDLEPWSGAGGFKRVTIRNNTISGIRLNFLANQGSGTSTQEDLTVENNTVLGQALKITSGSATITVRRTRYIIRNNSSSTEYGSPSPLMNFFNIDNLTVTGNVNPLDPARSMIGVRATGSCIVAVSGNQFAGAAAEAEIVPYTC
jgi:hypothetical protein